MGDEVEASIERATSPEKGAMTISLPQTLVVAIVTALVSSLGTSGGITMLSGSTPDDVREEILILQSDIGRLNEKLDDIYTVINEAHPRRTGQ